MPTCPAGCAAPPAPAMMARSPRPRASRPYRTSLSGVRWAETTSTSCGMPNSVNTSLAAFITRQSESEPMTTPTTGVSEECSGRVTGPG